MIRQSAFVFSMMDNMVEQTNLDDAVWKVNMVFIINRGKRLFEPVSVTYSGISLEDSLYRYDKDFYPVQLHTKNEVLYLRRDGTIISEDTN